YERRDIRRVSWRLPGRPALSSIHRRRLLDDVDRATQLTGPEPGGGVFRVVLANAALYVRTNGFTMAHRAHALHDDRAHVSVLDDVAVAYGSHQLGPGRILAAGDASLDILQRLALPLLGRVVRIAHTQRRSTYGGAMTGRESRGDFRRALLAHGGGGVGRLGE